MRWTAWLVRVVGDHGALLVAIERLDRGVDVQHPWRIEQCLCAVADLIIEPRRAFVCVNRLEPTTQRIFTDDLRHAQQSGIDAITANGSDMCIAAVTRQDRQQPRAQDIRVARSVRACVSQRAAIYPALPQPRQREKLDKERQLPHRCRSTPGIPAHIDPATGGLNGDRRRISGMPISAGQTVLTHRVTSSTLPKPIACQRFLENARGQLPLLG